MTAKCSFGLPGSLLVALVAACGASGTSGSPFGSTSSDGGASMEGGPPRTGGDGSAGQPTGGQGMGGQGTGGQGTGGQGSTASDAGGQGADDAGGGGSSGAPDAGAPSAAPDSGPPSGPDAAGAAPCMGADPVAGGTLVFSSSFEQNSLAGLELSPPSLPPDRIQITDDPLGQRCKVVRIEFMQGDNYRTSSGTQPRSWLSSAPGYTVMPGKKVSVAFGFMTDNPSWGAHFGQIIQDGGPLWMMFLSTASTVAAEVHRGSGGGKVAAPIQAMKWYDFRIDTDFSPGGTITFYMDGQMIGTGQGMAGSSGRFDCGIYWYNGPQDTRTAWISNISIGEL
jgi:hypothetical protein